MSPEKALRLFEDKDLLTKEELAAEADGATDPRKAPQEPNLDAANLWISQDDGLLVRGVKPHSAQKSCLVSRGIDTVTTAMREKWFATKEGLQYLELYSGPGRLLDERTGQEQPGSPVEALDLTHPFTAYVFSDFSEDCVAALRARTEGRANVSVLQGDANDDEHLGRALGLLNPKALVIAYLDPARPQDLAWTTVARIADELRFVDLIINLPAVNLMRGIYGAHSQGATGGGAAGRFLNHRAPHELLRYTGSRPNAPATIAAIRQHYDASSSLWASVSRRTGRSISRPGTRTTTCS